MFETKEREVFDVEKARDILDDLNRCADPNVFRVLLSDACDEIVALEDDLGRSIFKCAQATAERDAALARCERLDKAFDKLYLDAEDGGLMHGEPEHRAWLEAHLNEIRAALDASKDTP